ncbi:MAG: agmatinase [Polyangiales bacterium]
MTTAQILPMTTGDELAALLRPAAGGLYVVSTGLAEQQGVQRTLYGVSTDAEVQARFRATLDRIADARIIMLGIPSDVGAGYLRGANLGPQAVREALFAQDHDWSQTMERLGVIDVGDVFVVPQLLHDSMLNDPQIAATRRALYANLPPAHALTLPVSPLSIAERALDLIFSINPNVAPVVIGGDHSTAWPVASALSRVRKDRWGIVQPDAHTDLLEERLGVKYCFATWSYHANELLGRDGRMVQVGTRASRRDRQHWESTLGVRQFWATECRAHPARVLDDIIAHLRQKRVSSVYFSNDIDGTDDAHADATGTPEPHGLDPEFVVELIRRLGRDIGLCGGDIMEVAPSLERRPGGGQRTVSLAARYLRETMMAIANGAGAPG